MSRPSTWEDLTLNFLLKDLSIGVSFAYLMRLLMGTKLSSIFPRQTFVFSISSIHFINFQEEKDLRDNQATLWQRLIVGSKFSRKARSGELSGWEFWRGWGFAFAPLLHHTLPLNKYITSSVGKVQFSDKERLVRYCVKKRTEKKLAFIIQI